MAGRRILVIDDSELIRAVAELALGREIPVIFLTGQADTDDRERFAMLGATGVIGKPFEPSGLAAEVSGLLGWSL